MRTLIVGIGALGGLIATRAGAAGISVALATRDEQSAARFIAVGLRVSGVGGDAAVPVTEIAPLNRYLGGEPFDLIILATKAYQAIETAPRLRDLLLPAGTLLPIQNGGVARLLADRLGEDTVLGGLSNFGATMVSPGVYEQRNAGYFLIGELSGGISERARRVQNWLGQAIDVRVSTNLSGAVWSKLLLNCSVTTIGAIAGCSMRNYIATPKGRELFDRTYHETLRVALASGIHPERMIVDPIPPDWNGRDGNSNSREQWIREIVAGYGDLKPSMLQDFERGNPTEIDFINGYVSNLGQTLGIPTPINSAIVKIVHEIEAGERRAESQNVADVLTRGTESGSRTR